MNIRPYIPIGIATLSLLVCVGLYIAAYYLLSDASVKAASLATQAAAKQAEVERATQAHVALGSLESEEATLDQYSVTKTDIVPFLGNLQGTATPFGGNMSVISVSDEKEGKHARIALSLTITGSFDAVMRTLGTIEYSPYDSVVRNVILTTDPSSSGKGGALWNATVAYSVGTRIASSSPSKP